MADAHHITIPVTHVDDADQATIQEQAGGAVSQPFDAQKGSRDADAGSQPPSGLEMISYEKYLLTLASVRGELEPTPQNLRVIAYEEWSSSIEKLTETIYKVDEEIRSVRSEISQMIGFFSAFQGLLITAAAQSNLLRCINVGFVLALSAFATVVAVVGILQKNGVIRRLQCETNWGE